MMYELLCYNGEKYTYTIHTALSVIKSSLVLCHKVIKLLPHRKIDWTVGKKGGHCHCMNDSRETEEKIYNNHDKQLHGILYFMCWAFFVICTLQINKCKNANTTKVTLNWTIANLSKAKMACASFSKKALGKMPHSEANKDEKKILCSLSPNHFIADIVAFSSVFSIHSSIQIQFTCKNSTET